MDYKCPYPTEGEQELNLYDEYLKKCDCKEENNKISPDYPAIYTTESEISKTAWPEYLKSYIGKLIRVESLIGECLEKRIGTLMQVGSDFIVIKLYQGCSTMVIEASSIKYITVIHDNDMNKAGLY